ncbi:DUF2948 family protein [Martelella alba]|uniref:DUF2948 family protein n=1 Tax=Martelella alba TaxID=2590451 RepID=A0A506UGH0_9HYPH|nr:DUF2948 family protein [Martelella alba]TPW32179.1 DUF2948 family protein [Martelella alba]
MSADLLKLMALDEEDLAILSAYMQDAVFLTKDARFSQESGLFELRANRFVWEKKRSFFRKPERRRTSLIFKRVQAVRSVGIIRGATDKVSNLLAIQFEKNGEGPDGSIILSLSGGGEIMLDVEVIEVALSDISGSWEARATPRHRG